MTDVRKVASIRKVRLVVLLDPEVYEGTTDAQVAELIDHALGDYGIGLDGFLAAEVRR